MISKHTALTSQDIIQVELTKSTGIYIYVRPVKNQIIFLNMKNEGKTILFLFLFPQSIYTYLYIEIYNKLKSENLELRKSVTNSGSKELDNVSGLSIS